MKFLSFLTTAAIFLLIFTNLGYAAGLGIRYNLLPQPSKQAEAPLISVNTQATENIPTPTLTQQNKIAKTAVASSTKVIPPTSAPVPTGNQTITQNPTPAPSIQEIIPTETAAPTTTPVPTDPPPPPPVDNRCIVTISGNGYDVTSYRNIHSGGDIFQCGTDMTDIFLGRHPASYLQRMSQYKI